jgi:Fe-S cluster assembly protein SufD
MGSTASLLPIANPSAAELALLERYVGLRADPRRERNFAAFARTGLPHRRVEAFKWSDFRAQAGKPEGWQKAEVAGDALKGLTHTVIGFEGGGVRQPSQLPKGLRIVPLDACQAFAGAEENPLGALAAALADRPALLGIEISELLEAPLHLVFSADAALSFQRVTVIVRAGASAEVLESYLGGAGFSAALIEYELEAGSRVTRVIFQAASGPAVQASTGQVTLNTGCRFAQTVLASGAKLARLETHLVHAGAGAEASLNAAYLVGGKNHLDLTSHVRHSVAGGTTKQLTRGAVSANGRAVFQGKFYVARHAVKTDARMAHNALVLSPEAAVFAKPELQIYADDVQCAHGNTVGELDALQVFYLRQRGISQPQAQAMLTRAFLLNALSDGIGEPVLAALEASLDDRLGAMFAEAPV